MLRVKKILSHLNGSHPSAPPKQKYACIIIGAGASGLSAARKLVEEGINDFLILEARGRIGGRIETDYSFSDFSLEKGAEFIHGEKTSLNEWMAKYGLSATEVVRYPNLHLAFQPGEPAVHIDLLPEDRRVKFRRLMQCFNDFEDVDLSKQPDISLKEALEAQGWDEESIHIMDCLIGQTCCADIHSISLSYVLREFHNEGGPREFRIKGGYSRLINKLAENLPIQLHSLVTRVSYSPGQVEVELRNGQKYLASKCLITVPVTILQKQLIHFDPPLPEKKQEALKGLKMTAATKIVLVFSEPVWPSTLTFMAHPGFCARWWNPAVAADPRHPRTTFEQKSEIRQHPIVAYSTSSRAEYLDSLSERDAVQLALTELATLITRDLSELQSTLVYSRRVSWAADPFALGGYAYNLVGYGWAAQELARPVQDVLYFAGEAVATHSTPQTVQCALDSGTLAGTAISKGLKR